MMSAWSEWNSSVRRSLPRLEKPALTELPVFSRGLLSLSLVRFSSAVVMVPREETTLLLRFRGYDPSSRRSG
jgi:hypothetical protein